MADSVPSGTITFLFTDIEGSTKIAQAHREGWPGMQQRHHEILGAAMEARGGYVFQVIGDAFCVAFSTAEAALLAAMEAQVNLSAEPWGDAPLRVRMGIHTGTAHAAHIEHGGEGYSGYAALVRVQRVMSTAHGGQILLSNTTADLLQGELPAGVRLRDMEAHRLKGLANPERLWQVEAPGLAGEFPALQTLDGIPNNLPLQLTSFVGREKETGKIGALLEHGRLVTLTGPGGIGKTRLALQCCTLALESFPDGVWVVELEAISEGDLVAPVVAGVLGLHDEQGRTLLATLQDHLRARKALLLLDNCEHLLDSTARLADALIRSCPRICLITTSREALGIEGEAVYRVSSLGLPDPQNLPSPERLLQYDSVRLFTDRVLAVKSDFAVADSNALAVAQICARLDGIPLALELAASRVRGLAPEQIAQRLDESFRLLTGGSRTALPRHQTLRATIEWSYELLSDAERALLRRLAVFHREWTLQAAEAVCPGGSAAPDGTTGTHLGASDILDLTLRLVDKSLVVAASEGQEAHYRMMETIRQFAEEQLRERGEERAARLRHLEYFLGFAEREQPELQTSEQLSRLRSRGADYENLRAALQWAGENKTGQPPQRLARATERQADAQSVIGVGARSVMLYKTALQWLEESDEQDADMEARLHAKIVERASYFKWHLEADEYRSLLKIAGESRDALVAALRKQEDGPPSLEKLRLLLALADAYNLPRSRDLDKFESYARSSVTLAEQLDSPESLAKALDKLAELHWWRGDWREGAAVALRELALIRELPSVAAHQRAKALLDIGSSLVDVGEYREALPLLEESHSLSAELQLGELEVNALQERVHALMRLDRWEEALDFEGRLRALQQQYPRDQIGGACMTIAFLGSIHALRGETELARGQREEAHNIMLELGGPPEEWIWRQHF